ncbi:toast rack family protein [Gottfriedia sp. OAE603]|uniref:toast rack family protein n=1 Tax=Gottfriedia sp. OAE603 TaxID=2663872 RepID=UPI00178BA361
MKKSFFIAVLVGATLVVTTGCSIFTNGKVKEELISIEKDNAKSLDVKVDLGAGKLNVKKGGNEWVEGIAEYSHKPLKPEVSYKLNGSKGKVKIEQGKHKLPNMKIGKFKNEWNLTLTDKIPLDLDVNAGASKTILDLKGLELNSLDIENGVGELTVDLGGDWKHGFNTKIETGVGKTTIILPSDIGVKIHSDKGIGKANVVDFISKGNGVYVNEAYENGKETLNVDMDMGVGEVSFKLD